MSSAASSHGPSGTSAFGIGAPRLDPAELAERWRRARRAALARVAPECAEEVDESRAFAAVGPERSAELSEALFRNSWRLGRSAAERFGALRGVAASAALLAGLGATPCLGAGAWRTEGTVARNRRSGCRDNPERSPVVCDAWREAIDGLVCGLGDGVRFARWQSRGHGGDGCEDLLHAADEREMAWGESPAAVAPSLAAIAEGLAARGVAVRFLGLAENRLAYLVEAAAVPACGAAGGIVHALIENHVHHRLPGVELTAVSPRAVL